MVMAMLKSLHSKAQLKVMIVGEADILMGGL
jgi:hypothetical protein